MIQFGGDFLPQFHSGDPFADSFSGLFLCEKLTAEQRKRLFSDSCIAEYAGGEPVTVPFADQRAVGYILSGCARIYSGSGTHAVLLNTLSSGSVFGAASVLTDLDPYPTRILAKGKTEILFLSSSSIEGLITENADAALAFIRFLSGRVRFLNDKIAGYTSGSAHDSLWHYLLSLPRNSGKATLPISLAKLAMQLGISRASLYRAMDSLAEENLIIRTGRTIKFMQGLPADESDVQRCK